VSKPWHFPRIFGSPISCKIIGAYIEPFLLAKDSVNQPTAFELDLIDGRVRYVYGFSATQEKIIDGQ
jgi:hypothetical protein